MNAELEASGQLAADKWVQGLSLAEELMAGKELVKAATAELKEVILRKQELDEDTT